MAGRAWKISALLTVLALFALLEFQAVDAQALVNDCRTGAEQCDVNAYCYDMVTAYRCRCRPGWYGDGYVGAGYTGCRRWLATWQMATTIVGSILGSLLIVCCLLAHVRNAMRARSQRNMGQQGDPAYGYPAQQPFPPQQGVPMYATNTQKVPGPAGVV